MRFMSNIKSPGFLIPLTVLFLTAACSKDNDGGKEADPYDPGKPITISHFSPDSGGKATQLVITGDNFGNDTAHIRLSVGGKKAVVVGVKNNKIYALVPRKLSGDVDLQLKVHDREVSAQKRFRYIITQSVSTISGKVGPDGKGVTADGPLAEAQFSFPQYITADDEGNLMVLQYDGTDFRGLRQVSISQNKVTRIPAGSPYGITIRKSDNQVIAIQRDNQYPVILTGLAPLNSWQPKAFYATTAGSPVFGAGDYPLAGAYDNTSGKLYVYNWLAGRLNYVNPATKEEKVVTQFNFNGFGRVAVDNNGVIYASSRARHCIFKVDPATGNTTIFAGTDGGAGFLNGPGANAKFNAPEDMVFDSQNNMYVADSRNNCIRKVTPTGLVTTYAGMPEEAAGYEDGLPLKSKFNFPNGVAVDKNDVLYVTDMNNHRIRAVTVE
ncbi:IPT/TIG domain-containing protein [Chitinophaga caseinilytica]|uniref:IPT/TIG domain-containing protein n=1 Tax=Chitinophaga caseinilytica TaxID=2267521 RepID=A0ABZ2Z3P8_9BACT